MSFTFYMTGNRGYLDQGDLMQTDQAKALFTNPMMIDETINLFLGISVHIRVKLDLKMPYAMAFSATGTFEVKVEVDKTSIEVIIDGDGPRLVFKNPTLTVTPTGTASTSVSMEIGANITYTGYFAVCFVGVCIGPDTRFDAGVYAGADAFAAQHLGDASEQDVELHTTFVQWDYPAADKARCMFPAGAQGAATGFGAHLR